MGLSLDDVSRGLALEGADAAAFAALFTVRRSLAKSEFLSEEGDQPLHLSVLLDGFAQAVRLLPEGRQQSLALFLPGDLLDLSAFVLGRSSVAICALSQAVVGQARKSAVEALIAERPRAGRALWQAMARQSLATEEWLVGLGRRTAFERLAHLICELMHRERAAGLASQANCIFPLTQRELADMLGLSGVHVNRILQQLRSEGLIRLAQGRLTICDEARLNAAGGFQPDYLAAPPAFARKFDETLLLRPGHPQPA